MKRGSVLKLVDNISRTCDDCDVAYEKTIELQRFPYGEGEAQIDLYASVPVWRCKSCGDAYTDFEAENARHDAVCAYLGRMTPSQIVDLRTRHGMSQEEWAENTSIGLASIKRWESGSLIQGASHDSYMRLLNDGIGYARHLAVQKTQRAASPPIFRTEFSPTDRQEARAFQLRMKRA